MISYKLIDRITQKANKLYIIDGNVYQHFTFILDRNKIVCWGRNDKKKTDPLSHFHGYSYFKVHSELAAIKNFPYKPSLLCEYSIANVRLNKKQQLVMAKPCHKCQQLLEYFDIKDVIYSDEKGEFRKL